MAEGRRKYSGAITQFMSDDEIANITDHVGIRSWAFNPYLETTSDLLQNELDLLLDDLCYKWASSFQRKPSRNREQAFIDIAKVILVNLLRAYSKSDKLVVGMGSRKETLDRERQYRPEFIKTQLFLTVRDYLIASGVLRVQKKGYYFPDNAAVARYELTAKGIETLWFDELTTSDFISKTPKGLIVLKNEEKRLIRFESIGELKRMRANLMRINELIDQTDIMVRGVKSALFKRSEWHENGNRLYRVFNNSSFEQGGRFYGGWWQNIKSHYRKYIEINYEKTVELDYAGFNPSVLLARAGVEIPRDPYQQIPIVAQYPDLRDRAKSTLAGLINSSTGNTDEPKSLDEKQYQISKVKFREDVVHSFPNLKNQLGQNLGLKLQRDESDLAEEIMLEFANHGISVLPIHDAFIVQSQYGDQLKALMIQLFEKKFGVKPYIAKK